MFLIELQKCVRKCSSNKIEYLQKKSEILKIINVKIVKHVYPTSLFLNGLLCFFVGIGWIWFMFLSLSYMNQKF